MNLENQVASLPLSKRLREMGERFSNADSKENRNAR